MFFYEEAYPEVFILVKLSKKQESEYISNMINW